MLADVRCQSTTSSSTEHTASLKVDTVCYDEFLHRIIADRCSSASKKGKWLFGSGAELRLEKVRGLMRVVVRMTDTLLQIVGSPFTFP